MSVSDRQTIQTTAAPAAIGPYAQAVAAGPYLFASGQIALDPVTGGLIDGDAAAQTRQVMANVAAVLAAAGLAFADIVKTTIFLTDMADFAAVNAVYGECFEDGPVPARSTVAVAALPRGSAVEIEVLALRR
ncbi:MAG: 2-iminobutanoate/2-iminopropanoate deaminase [Candidatus Eremiobacteraeota bacterium]|nr:2-iminobutanoate/2-iminopropanoate deaminase [Candidatus Eremiobacteraeota bacterium]